MKRVHWVFVFIALFAVVLPPAVVHLGAAEDEKPEEVPPNSVYVLLDEYWSPEIVQNGVAVTEIDTEATGDPTQAVSGDFSAMLVNTGGAPSVRFRNAAGLRWFGLYPDRTEGRLWYRTDGFDGKLRMGIWVYVHEVGRPVEVLVADLDGGGEHGHLITDDRWHQARGRLVRGADYNVVATGGYTDACYVWIRPSEGWNIPHRTYIDRVEMTVVEGPRRGRLVPRPVHRVRSRPGTQVNAPGLILWEGEDTIQSDLLQGGLYVPNHAEQQSLLSNGAWLNDIEAGGNAGAWKVRVSEAGTYDLWLRGFWYEGSFRWQFDGGRWHTSGPDRKTQAEVKYVESDKEAWGISALMVGWTNLGKVQLAAGEHRLEVVCGDNAVGHAFDCWVLAKEPFVPPGSP